MIRRSPALTAASTLRSAAVSTPCAISDQKEWLDEMGFVWDDLERRWDVTQTVLTVHKEEHADLLVPKACVVQSNASWAEEAWGIKLGSMVNDIRHQGIYLRGDEPERKEWLDEMGFHWRTPSPTRSNCASAFESDEEMFVCEECTEQQICNGDNWFYTCGRCSK
jgi:hypothetical protein